MHAACDQPPQSFTRGISHRKSHLRTTFYRAPHLSRLRLLKGELLISQSIAFFFVTYLPPIYTDIFELLSVNSSIHFIVEQTRLNPLKEQWKLTLYDVVSGVREWRTARDAINSL